MACSRSNTLGQQVHLTAASYRHITLQAKVAEETNDQDASSLELLCNQRWWQQERNWVRRIDQRVEMRECGIRLNHRTSVVEDEGETQEEGKWKGEKVH